MTTTRYVWCQETVTRHREVVEQSGSRSPRQSPGIPSTAGYDRCGKYK